MKLTHHASSITRYFTEIVYGRTPRRMSYQGIPATIDTVRINRLPRQFLTQVDWFPYSLGYTPGC